MKRRLSFLQLGTGVYTISCLEYDSPFSTRYRIYIFFLLFVDFVSQVKISIHSFTACSYFVLLDSFVP